MPIYPISFSIPESKIVKEIPKKNKKFSNIVPNHECGPSTYIFNNELEYYKEYQESLFAVTRKKGGYDCMRHYEILANGCIPYFVDLNNCPINTLTHLPKKLILNAIHSDAPEQFLPQLLEYTSNNLTTRKMAEYMLSKLSFKSNNILFLSDDPSPDYLRCLTLIGLKEIYGKNCVENVIPPHIYTDYDKDIIKISGRGFSFTKIIDPINKSDNNENIIENIINKKYDVIIYGSVHRGMPFLNLVLSYYNNDNIIFICGEDLHNLDNCPACIYGKDGFISFVRELYY